MREIMEHLLRGGWVKEKTDVPGVFSYYEMRDNGELWFADGDGNQLSSMWSQIGGMCRLQGYEARFELIPRFHR